MNDADTTRSTGQLMSDIAGNVSNLVRAEADLVRAEISESVSKAAGSLAVMAGAMVLALVGLIALAAAVVAMLVLYGMPAHWASAAVGGVLLLIALILFLSAKSALQQIGFVPTRAARNLQRDAAAIKESFRDT